MTRRGSIALLAGSAFAQRPGLAELDGLLPPGQGVALAMDFRTKAQQWFGPGGSEAVRGLAAMPGSVVKPLSLMALIGSGKLSAKDTIHCTGQLQLGGASFACAHPKVQTPIDTATALAYSCNEFVAHMATRFAPGELADAFSKYGLKATRVPAGAATQLQALGERNVTATALQMAGAYHRLAGQCAAGRLANSEPILLGLEGAVEYGTAQRAAVAGIQVAGKTGTAPGSWAWFAGFARSRDPRVVVVVLVPGHAGGADAAPIAGRLLAAKMKGRPAGKP
jgi:cell division protein FtsI/penicillin-binding protein 2